MVSAGGKVAFPGVVDGHQHWGIYNPLPEIDATSESRASAQGGVTTALSYMRTGQYYLNKGGPYAEFFPEVLSLTEGKAVIDYAFHLAPMSKEHIGEIPSLVGRPRRDVVQDLHVLRGHGLHGRSDDQIVVPDDAEDERYDYAHFEFVMRGIESARQKYPEHRRHISLSLHCETAEIMTAYTQLVEEDGTLTGLRGLQRVAAAALRGTRRHDRVVPRARDRPADDQPAAPDLAQGGRGGTADGATRSRTSTSGAR